MVSKIRTAALRLDLSSTLWRTAITQDNRELEDLLPEQLRELAAKYPEDSQQYVELCRVTRVKENHAAGH